MAPSPTEYSLEQVELTGEFRQPRPDELFISNGSNPSILRGVVSGKRIILRLKESPFAGVSFNNTPEKRLSLQVEPEPTLRARAERVPPRQYKT